MAKPKESDKKKVLNTVVLWCCSGFFFILCGYGLYRQHCLEQRVLVLEKQFEDFMRAASGDQPKHQELALRRETRDAGDCVCPAESLGVRDLKKEYKWCVDPGGCRKSYSIRRVEHRYDSVIAFCEEH